MTETKYNKVKGWIRSKILDGTYVPNQKILSESELMKLFKVSRHTVRIAIGELVKEGWLYTERGAGTYCSNRTIHKAESAEIPQKKIAIITTYISDYIFPSIIRGAEAEISQEGYQVSLFSTNNDHDQERRILEAIITQRFDGVIIEATMSATLNPNINYYLHLESIGIPYIMINAFYEELEPISVVIDDEKGGYLQTEHLIKLGHKRIAGFFKTDDLQGVKRMKGYIKALRDHGLSINSKNIITYSTSEKLTKPAECLKAMLDSGTEQPTGLVCYNDELVMRLLDILRQKDMNIPEDISVVGFDNSFLAEITEVKLTTIEHPKSELGKVAAQKILEIIKKGKTSKQANQLQSVVFDTSLIIRNSTKAIG
ncbi:GntR family transcriptional regulator [Bacillus sp. DNRA2]|uniref:GntR family transcriptional regulator n=1 Tax=Bacillus sp. DNRA2 TaxID=2723053 RepID=UPI0032B7BD7E